jgi:TP901 family phage tail tape measure protein
MSMARGKNTISVRIALEGGKDIQEQLQALGQRGEEAFAKLRRAADAMGSPASGFVAGLKELQGQLQSAAKEFKKFGDEMTKTGRYLSTRVTAPIVGLGALSLKMAGDFEQAMNQVAAVSGSTGDQLSELRAKAREMGETTMFSASESANAMSFLAMAGFDANEILGAIPGTLQLAASANMDLARSADIVSNVLTGYNKEISELAHVNDVLVKAFTSANTNLEQLGEALKYAGPIASAAGVDFETTAAALSLMGNAGVQASMAGTSLRGAISRMLNPTNQMRGVMEELGISFTDTNGRLLDFDRIIEQLEPHVEDAGAFMQLFGQRAGPAMAALVSQGSEALRDLDSELRNAGGTAERIGKVQMEGFNGAVRELRSAFEGLMIAIAEAGLIQAMTDLAKQVTSFIRVLSATNPEILRMGTVIAAVVAAVGPLLIGLGLVVKSIGTIAGAAAGLIGLLLRLRANFLIAGVGVSSLTAAFAALVAGAKMAVAGLAGLLGWPALLIAGLVAAAVAIYNYWDEIVDYGGRAWEAIKGAASGAWGFIDNLFSGTAGELWEDLKASASSTWDAIASGASAAGSAISDAFSTIREFGFDGVAQVAARAWDGIASGASLLVDGLRLTFEGLGSALGIVWEGIAAAGRLVWSGIEEAASAAWAVVGAAARRALDGIAQGWGVVSDGAAAAWREVSAGAESLWRGIIAVFERNQGALIAAFDRLFSGMSEGWQKLVDEAQRVRDQIIAPFQQAGDRIRAIWDDTGQAIARAVATLPQIARDVVAEASRAIEGFSDIGTRIEGVFRSLAAAIDQIMNQIARRVEATIRAIEAALARLEARIRRVQAAASAAASASSSSSSSSSGAQTFATGGYVKGPGTTTSDSIPAWLSNNEFVHNAKAVRYYGVDFMRALNAMKIPRDILKKIRGFSGGGLATQKFKSGLPAFSAGGLVDAFNSSLAGLAFDPVRMPSLAPAAHPMANLHPVTLDLGGGRQVEGLYARPDVIDEISREAAQQRLLSLGPAPGWSGSW